MPLPMDFSGVLDAFARPTPIEVWEETGARVNGRWTIINESPHRSIKSIVMQADVEHLTFTLEGVNPKGSKSIITNEKLYYHEQYGGQAQGIQSFALIDGRTYRVYEDGDMNQNTRHNAYTLIRYEKNSNPVDLNAVLK